MSEKQHFSGFGLGFPFQHIYIQPAFDNGVFAYADDLALLHSSANWKDLEGILIQDMITL